MDAGSDDIPWHFTARRFSGRSLVDNHTLWHWRSVGLILHSNGDMAKDELCSVLWANSAQIRQELQVLWLLETIHLRVYSISWLTRSIWPLDWGQNLEDRLIDVPIRWPKAFQNWEVNCDPRSETMYWGNPWILKTCCIMKSAVWQAVGILGRGIRWHALENLSTTTKMTVLPCDLGSPVTKSKEICFTQEQCYSYAPRALR